MSQQRKPQSEAIMFFRKNQNIILGVISAIVLLVIGYMAYKNWIVAPKNKKAIEQMYQAQYMFEKDSFNQALNNPGVGGTGFLKIITNYSGTESANLAKYYAGICYLNLGQFDNAIKYLEDYKPADDMLTTMKHTALGDAYSEKGNDTRAMDNYQKAVKTATDDVTGPYAFKKLAFFAEKMKQWSLAESSYQTLMDKFPTSADVNNAELGLERMKLKTGK